MFCFGDKFLRGWLSTKTYHNWFVWITWNFKTTFGKKKLNYIVRWIWIKEKNITYVKDEGANLNAMIVAQNFVVSCEILNLDESFLIHAMAMHFLKHANMEH